MKDVWLAGEKDFLLSISFADKGDNFVIADNRYLLSQISQITCDPWVSFPVYQTSSTILKVLLIKVLDDLYTSYHVHALFIPTPNPSLYQFVVLI